MSSPEDYKATLNKMATLEGLTKFISDSTATSNSKRGSLITLLQSMQKNIGTVRTQIDTIKQSGATAKIEIQQVIKDADTKQQQTLQNIQSSITAMMNLGELEAAVNKLNTDITGLVNVSQGTYADAAKKPGPGGQPQGPGGQWPRGQTPPGSGANTGANRGGYTYGKSRRGKGKRRRRTKKSRRKGRR